MWYSDCSNIFKKVTTEEKQDVNVYEITSLYRKLNEINCWKLMLLINFIIRHVD